MKLSIKNNLFLPIDKAPEYLRLRINDKLTFSDLCEFPSYVYLEVTADCNAHCRMCTFSHNQNRFMSDELFNAAKKEILENKKYIKYVVVQGRGEPLLDPKIIERVSVFSRDNDIPTFMSTNAELLDEKMAIGLLEAKISTIVLSIDSLNKKVYEKIRYGLNFEQVLNNILRFLELRDKINPQTQCRIRMIEQNTNIGEWDEFEAYWKPKLKPHDRLTIKKVHSWGGKLKITDVRDIDTDQNHFPCVALWSYFAILYNGEIPLCPGDGAIEKYNMGNFSKTTIKELWKSKKWEFYRLEHLNGKKIPTDMCADCRMFAEPSDFEHIGKKMFPELYV